MKEQTCEKGDVYSKGVNGRRNFLKTCSVFLASLIGIAYAIPLVRVFISPSMRNIVKGTSGLFDVGEISEYQVNVPKKVPIKDSKIDAWVKFPPTEIGAVWIILGQDKKLTIFSSNCPHLGCGVDWDQNTGRFICPCHESYFDIKGNVLNGPAPRGLDTLETDIKQGRIYVRYQKMKLGISKKIPV